MLEESRFQSSVFFMRFLSGLSLSIIVDILLLCNSALDLTVRSMKDSHPVVAYNLEPQ